MGEELPDIAAGASVDALIEQLRARVEERRRSGDYPPGLEEDLDAHFRHIAEARRGSLSLREHAEALRESSAFARERISFSSRIRVGSWWHRAVGKAVARQTSGVLDQVTLFAAEVCDTVDAMIEPLEALGASGPWAGSGSSISRQIETLHAVVVEQRRALNAQREDLLAIIERRIRLARPVDVEDAPFRPWFENERFEAAFRGSRKDLLARYRDLAERLVGCDPVLDIGFGRGELLELLAGLGVEARGVESDPLLVKLGEELGLEVLLDDGNNHLRTISDGSLGGLALIQVVEHLTAQQLVDLVALAARKVRPGGKVIMETVNPQSLMVFARSFYLDPTHVRPVHPAYLEFLFREAGFSEVELDWRSPPREREVLHEVPGDDEATRQLNANIANLNALLFAPQDYAIIATR
jgi:2-polyprenyl-3-methyl-5-hydroxy-6-metoxy-1,4-benzoquinol methylase